VKGAYPDEKTKLNVVWGWIKISKITARYPNFRGTFHEARYQLALTHLEHGRRLKSPEERTRYFQYAKNDILNTQTVFPDMGGEADRRRYDKLMRDVQTELKETPSGLKANDKSARPGARGAEAARGR
jgi:hypothetical protein